MKTKRLDEQFFRLKIISLIKFFLMKVKMGLDWMGMNTFVWIMIVDTF